MPAGFRLNCQAQDAGASAADDASQDDQIIRFGIHPFVYVRNEGLIMKKFLIAFALLPFFGTAAVAQTDLSFRAGAAKIEITPAAASLLPGDSIRDPLFVRAIVVSNGTSCAVLVGVDQVGMSGPVANSAIERAALATGCAPANFVVSATHTHSGYTHGFGDPRGEPNSRRVEDAIVAAATQAAGRLQTARIGYGTVSLDINVNRDSYSNGQWLQGPNLEGPSDKTMALITFVDSQDQPIATYINYAMHPINFYLSGVVSGDIPGEASRYVERQFGPEMVAVFAQGASGDQNPLLLGPMYNLIANRTAGPDRNDTRLNQVPPWVQLARERNGNNRLNAALASQVPADQLAAYRSAIDATSELVSAEGAFMGAKVVNTMRFGTPVLIGSGPIAATGASLQCPGRVRIDREDPVREGSLPPYADGDDVIIREGMLRIGDIYIASVDAEVYSEIATRLKQESPVSQIMMTTLANGWSNSGYIYSNNATGHLTFQVISSSLKPGCAEDLIVNSGLQMIRQIAQ